MAKKNEGPRIAPGDIGFGWFCILMLIVIGGIAYSYIH